MITTRTIAIVTALGAASAITVGLFVHVIIVPPHLALALTLTLVIEIPVYVAVLRPLELTREQVVAYALAANVGTHCVGFAVIEPHLRPILSVTAATAFIEAFAIIGEALIFAAAVRRRNPTTLTTLIAACALANSLSFTLGWLAFRASARIWP